MFQESLIENKASQKCSTNYLGLYMCIIDCVCVCVLCIVCCVGLCACVYGCVNVCEAKIISKSVISFSNIKYPNIRIRRSDRHEVHDVSNERLHIFFVKYLQNFLTRKSCAIEPMQSERAEERPYKEQQTTIIRAKNYKTNEKKKSTEERTNEQTNWTQKCFGGWLKFFHIVYEMNSLEWLYHFIVHYDRQV